ncbi:MAG: hypothetical protein ACP5IA_03320 [Sediminispirochaetaceae bacterium]
MKNPLVLLFLLFFSIHGLQAQSYDMVEEEKGFRHLPTGTVFPRHAELDMETVIPYGYARFYLGPSQAISYYHPEDQIGIIVSLIHVQDTLEAAFNRVVNGFYRETASDIERSSPREKLLTDLEIHGYAREFTCHGELRGEKQILKTRLEFYLANGTGVLVRIHGTHDTAPEARRLAGEILADMTWPQPARSLPITSEKAFIFTYSGRTYRDAFWQYNLELVRDLQEDPRLSAETIDTLENYEYRVKRSNRELFWSIVCVDVIPLAALVFTAGYEEEGTSFNEWSSEGQTVFLAGNVSMVLGIGLLVHWFVDAIRMPSVYEVVGRANADLMDYPAR